MIRSLPLPVLTQYKRRQVDALQRRDGAHSVNQISDLRFKRVPIFARLEVLTYIRELLKSESVPPAIVGGDSALATHPLAEVVLT
jgi:hypothetical protein